MNHKWGISSVIILNNLFIRLISSYKYKEAISAYHSYKRTFEDSVPNDVLPLLEHAQLRLGLDYDGALQKSRKVGTVSLSLFIY